MNRIATVFMCIALCFGVAEAAHSVSHRTSAGYSSHPLILQAKDGSVIAVRDFTKQNQPSIAGPKTGYQVAGANTADFQILYFPDQSYFLVSLFVEPLGATRTKAEDALRQKLRLSDAQLCTLNIDVGTDAATNADYAGRNLGLSFCSNAVRLPSFRPHRRGK